MLKLINRMHLFGTVGSAKLKEVMQHFVPLRHHTININIALQIGCTPKHELTATVLGAADFQLTLKRRATKLRDKISF